MSSFSFLRKFRIIIAIILALMLSHMGISYMIILLAIGFIMALLSQSKFEAILTGILYVVVSYILSYPTGLFLANYLPTTNVTIQTSVVTVGIDLLMGVLIPSLVAVVFCGIAAVIGVNIVDLFHVNETNRTKTGEHHYKVMNTFEQHKQQRRKEKQEKERLLYLTPIQRAKIKKQNKDKKR